MPIPEYQCRRCSAPLLAGARVPFCSPCLAKAALNWASGDPPAKIEGRPFGRYRLMEEIGRGGAGVVYRAEQVGLQREVALKVLRQGPFADAKEIARFQKESVSAGMLRHPGIVTVYEVGEADGHFFFSMELVRGSTLAQLVKDGPMDPHRSARYLLAVARAIAFAHAHGVIHRDLKPSNVILDLEDQPRVMDFGLAKRLQNGEATLTEHIAGSPAYMPPEATYPKSAPTGITSDIYSLGAMLYHLLTGSPPFRGDSVAAVFMQIQQTEPIAPHLLKPEVPLDLETICLKCLEKDSSRRYSSTEAFADDLERFLSDRPILARPVSQPEKWIRWARRQPAMAMLAASVVFLGLLTSIGGGFAAWRINVARRAEHRERAAAVNANQQLESANTRLSETVTFLEMQRAESLFASQDPSSGLGHLASILRRDPSNTVAAERIASALLHRNWMFPAGRAIRHTSHVSGLAFSPSGAWLASGDAEGQVRLFNTTSLQEVARTQLSEKAMAVRFSPNEHEIAAACATGEVLLWNWYSGQETRMKGRHRLAAMCVSFSSDGSRLASGSVDATVNVWSTRTGELLLLLKGHTDEVREVVFSPDGHRIATCSYDGTARVWDPETGNEVGPVLRHTGAEHRVLSVAFSPNGHFLMTASRDRTARIWDLSTGRPVGVPLRHTDGLNDAQFDPTARWVVTAGYENTARIWNLRTGLPFGQNFRHLEQVNHALFHPIQATLATCSDDGSVRLWDLRPSEVLVEPLRAQNPKVEVHCSAFSSDGKLIAVGGADGSLTFFDSTSELRSGEVLHENEAVRTLAFSPKGHRLAVGLRGGAAWVWDVESRQHTIGPLQHRSSIRTISFSPDGRWLLTGSADHTARVWNAETGSPQPFELRHQGEVVVANFNHDGSQIVTASADATARVWNSANGSPVSDPLLHLDKLRDAQFSPDGKRIVTASADNCARIWDLATSKMIGQPLVHLRTVESACFSPDGSHILTASLDRTARVWDASSGQPCTPPLTHDSGVSVARYSPNGQRIVTASADHTVRIWDSHTGIALSEGLLHPSPVKSARFSPDGNHVLVLTAYPDPAVRVWPLAQASNPIPSWLPDLAEAAAGISIGNFGTPTPSLDPDWPRLKSLVHQSALGSDNPLVQTAAWFLADTEARGLSPYTTRTRSEYIARRLHEGTRESLEEALTLCPTNAAILAKLAAIQASVSPSPDAPDLIDSQMLAQRALRFDPTQREAKQVMHQLTQP